MREDLRVFAEWLMKRKFPQLELSEIGAMSDDDILDHLDISEYRLDRLYEELVPQ